MIQRIQSVYFFLTTLLVLLFLPGTDLSFLNKSGAAVNVCFGGIYNMAAGGNSTEVLYVFPVFIIIIAAVSIAAIFLFRKRELQLLVSRILTGIIVLFGIYTAYLVMSVISRYEAHFVAGIKPFLIVVMLILSILASRGIKKDIDLVKSYDRLR